MLFGVCVEHVYDLINVTHIHSVEAKGSRVDNDSATYLWHCRLGHIGVKHIKKLHADGLLESLDACEPCLMGKMAKTPSLEQWSERLTYWK